MTKTTGTDATGEDSGGESSPPDDPTPPNTGVINENVTAQAEYDHTNDTVSDMESEDPNVPAADLRLLPPDNRSLMDRLWSVGRFLRSDQIPLRHLLTLGLVALVVVQVVILLLKAQEAAETERVEVAAAAKIRARPLVCDRPGCVLQAAETVLFINRSVDPCKDFFQYACGRFNEVYPSPAGETLDVAGVLQQQTHDRVLQLLREHQYYNGSSAISKARLFFSTCMRAYQFNLNDVPDLVELLRQFGGLDLLGTWNSDSWNFNDVLINASAVHLLDAFFETITWERELGVVDLHVPATLDLTLRITTRMHGQPPQKVANRTRHLIREVLRQLELDTMHQIPPPVRECNDVCVDEMAGDIVAVQEALLAITPKRKFFALRPVTTTARVTMSEMKLLVPQVDWRRLLDAMFGADIVPDPVTFSVPSRAYMAGVGRLIDDTRVKRLHHFLMWPVIRRYLVALGPMYATLGEELDLNISNREIVETREQQCSALLTKHMAPVLHGLLLASHIGEESVPRVRDYLLKQAFSALGDSFGWMTEESQRQSREFLDSIQVDFGLANLKQSLHTLDEYYAPLQFRKLKFFENLRSLYGFTKPGKVSDGFRVSRSPGDIDISYDVMSGVLTVPFSALQVPWYHTDVPDHLNAATLGSLVYRALADTFILSPYSPNMTYLWDDETQRHYNKFTHCLEAASQNSSVPTVESVLTLFMPPRNMSSNLSAETINVINDYFTYHVSYRLYKRLKHQEPNVVLPGMQHTSPDQAFYLAFAHTRCTNGFPLFFLPAFIHGNTMIAIRSIEPGIINHLMLSDPGFRQAYQCRGPVAAEHAVGLCSLF